MSKQKRKQRPTTLPPQIDTRNETVVSMGEAARHVSDVGEDHVGPPTVVRWTTRGCYGVRLASFQIGQRVFTSLERLDAFFHEVREAKLKRDREAREKRQAGDDHKQAEAEAERMGV